MPFLAGIITATSLDISISNEFFFSTTSILFILLLITNRHLKDSYKKRWIFGFVIFIFFLLAGNIITVNHNELKRADHFSNYLENKGYATLTIIEPVSERENSFRAVCRVNKIISDTIAYKVTGKVMLYFAKDSVASALSYGDKIITDNNFSSVSGPQNPHQFNYKRFLANNNIHFQGYRPGSHYKVIASGRGNILKSKALQLRQSAMARLLEHHIRDREFAVLSALLLGYRDYIDDDLRREFAGAGAMHILCVSGLHVGIIYLILNSLFMFLNKFKNGKIIKTIIVILLIWFYATLTGFSPSVLRASTMFSFVAAARSFNRYSNIYNILAASAFVLIIIDPYMVTKIGFQLSYIAVISIVTLQPYLHKMLKVKNKILDKAWAIITVSIAAQLAAGPLTLFYFNQFPNYFILTNLAVIPLASLIIYTALIFLAVSPIGIIAGFFGKTLSFLIFLMHKSVQFIEQLPYSNIQSANISLLETMIFFLLIITVSGSFIYKSKLYLRLSLLSILVMATSFSTKNINQQKQNIFIIYSISNHSAIDLISGKNCIFLASEDLLLHNNKQDIEFNIRQNRIRKEVVNNVKETIIGNKVKGFSKPYFWNNNSYYMFYDMRFKIITGLEPVETNENNNLPKVKLDYLIVSQDAWLDIIDLKRIYDFEKIIFDSSNSFWKINRWIEECVKLDVKYWSIRHQGAYYSYL